MSPELTAAMAIGGNPHDILREVVQISYSEAFPETPIARVTNVVNQAFESFSKRSPDWPIYAIAMLRTGLQPDWNQITPAQLLDRLLAVALFSMEERLMRQVRRTDLGLTEPLHKLRYELAMVAHEAYPEFGFDAAYATVDAQLEIMLRVYPAFIEHAGSIWAWCQR